MENKFLSERATEKFNLALEKSRELIEKSSLSHQEKVDFVRSLIMIFAGLGPDEVEEMAKNNALEDYILKLTRARIER